MGNIKQYYRKQMSKSPTFQQLKVLATVAEQQNMTKASQLLNVTQPALSTSIKQLEKYYQTPLIEVVNKKIFLTQAGTLAYETFQEVKKSIEHLEMGITKLKGDLRGTLTIAMVSTAKFFIPNIVGDFLKLHPKTKPKIIVQNRHEVLQTLKDNQCDLAILSQIPETMHMVTQKLAKNPLVIISAKNHTLAKEKKIPIERLMQETLITREQGAGIRDALEKLIHKAGFEPDFAMSLNSTEAIKKTVSAQIGISMVPLLSLQDELQLDKISVLDVLGTPINHYWYTVYPKGKKLSPIAEQFIEFLKQDIGKYNI